MTEKKNCWCFPNRKIIEEKYRTMMTTKHLAEKTTNDVASLLENENVETYDHVPEFAQYAYERYVCENSSNVMCRVVSMNRDMHISEIASVLDKIAIPCECEQTLFLAGGPAITFM